MSYREKLLNAGLIAVAEACQITRSLQHQIKPTEHIPKSDKSPVTTADFAAQAVIAHRLEVSLGPVRMVGEESSGILHNAQYAAVRKAIAEAVRPVWKEATEDKVLSAIDVGNHDGTASAYWTLDPIDGTKGFLRGGQYAISLAYIEHGEVVLGVMGCPNLSADFNRPFFEPDPTGLIYFAVKGKGSWVIPANAPNAKPTRVLPRIVDPTTAIRVCESVESSHSKQQDIIRIIKALGDAGEAIRLDGQCKYAVVARGQADAYLRIPTRACYVEHIWDHAAGMLIATEAGVIVTDMEGRPLDFSQGTYLRRNRGIVCAALGFHSRIIEAIKMLRLASS